MKIKFYELPFEGFIHRILQIFLSRASHSSCSPFVSYLIKEFYQVFRILLLLLYLRIDVIVEERNIASILGSRRMSKETLSKMTHGWVIFCSSVPSSIMMSLNIKISFVWSSFKTSCFFKLDFLIVHSLLSSYPSYLGVSLGHSLFYNLDSD